MPFIGLNIPAGTTSDSFSPGLRLGTLLGGHVAPFLSLNGEFTIDVLNPKNVPSGYDVSAVAIDLAFSPLFHVPTGNIEIVLGPKLGAFGYAASVKYSGASVDGNAQGLSYGLNIGVFGGVGKLAIGGLVGYTGRHATKVCSTRSGYSETCTDSPSGDDMKILSITGAVLF